MTWDLDIAAVVRDFKQGDADAAKRRASWPRVVEKVLLPTLREARDTLVKHGFGTAEAEDSEPAGGIRIDRRALVTGKNKDDPMVEVVQLYFGQSGLLGARHTQGGGIELVQEVGATLGYNLRIDGRVGRWHIDPWLSGSDDTRPSIVGDEIFNDASAISADLVRAHVLSLLKGALAKSYRGGQSKTALGFQIPIATLRG